MRFSSSDGDSKKPGIVDRMTWDLLDEEPPIEETLPPRRGAEVKLAVPYLSQRDNSNRPEATCNVTCLAMVLSYQKTNWPLFALGY